ELDAHIASSLPGPVGGSEAAMTKALLQGVELSGHRTFNPDPGPNTRIDHWTLHSVSFCSGCKLASPLNRLEGTSHRRGGGVRAVGSNWNQRTWRDGHAAQTLAIRSSTSLRAAPTPQEQR